MYLDILTGVFLKSFLTDEEIEEAYREIAELLNNTCAEDGVQVQ